MKVHCLFEQSGTFKNEFRKLGYEAYDYDILNDFGQTDFMVDIFSEIRGGYDNKDSLFDKIEKDDLILAFFPCTRFQENNFLFCRGLAFQQKNWKLDKKLETSMKWFSEINEMYELINKLTIIAIRRGFRLVIENPATKPHILSLLWIPSTFTDNDRTQNGDFYQKPTQYWFFGFEPYNNFVFEPIEYVEKRVINLEKGSGKARQVQRSMIHPQYANRFIRQYLIPQAE